MSGVRRMFIGLQPPLEVARELHAACQAVFATADRRGLRAYAAEDLHLTLCFLGEIDAALATATARALASEVAGAQPVRLRITHTGAFPSRGHERILWAGIDARDRSSHARLIALQHAAERAARAAGLAIAGRGTGDEWRAHITIARRDPRGAPVAAAFFDLPLELEIEAREVSLFESRRTPGLGTRYAVVERFPLRAGDR